jgi:hypothetical protein
MVLLSTTLGFFGAYRKKRPKSSTHQPPGFGAGQQDLGSYRGAEGKRGYKISSHLVRPSILYLRQGASSIGTMLAPIAYDRCDHVTVVVNITPRY